VSVGVGEGSAEGNGDPGATGAIGPADGEGDAVTGGFVAGGAGGFT
jgi:hypothetical protein